MNICTVPPGIPAFSPASAHRLYSFYSDHGDLAPIYSIIPLSEDEQREVIKEMYGEEEDLDNLGFAQPRWDFSDFGAGIDGMKECWAAHMRMTEELEDKDSSEFYHGVFFIVTTAEWRKKGILAVKVAEEAPTGHGVSAHRVDSMRIVPNMATMIIANLQISNMDWIEYKDWDECNMEVNEDASQGSQDEDSNDAASTLEQHRSKRLRQQQYWGIWPDIPPLNAQFLGVYVVKGIDPVAAIRDLELDTPEEDDDGDSDKKLPEEYDCQVLGHLDPGKDPIEEACNLHLETSHHGKVYPYHFIIVDQSDRTHDGVCLVELDPGSGTATTGSVVNRKITQHVQRVSCAEAHFVGQMSALGHRSFTYNHWSFALFSLNGPVNPGLLDTDWLRHEYGGERVIPGPAHRDDWGVITYDWKEAVKQFKLMCRKQRLIEKFHKHFFIVSDTSTPKETGVVLVGLDWDASYVRYNDVRTINEVTVNLENITARRCKVQMAYETLKAIADGDEPFDGLPLEKVSMFAA